MIKKFILATVITLSVTSINVLASENVNDKSDENKSSSLVGETYEIVKEPNMFFSIPGDNVESYKDENGIGEIRVKGPNVMLGYYENEEATKSALESDGWFHTGDLARIDKDGFIYISGRKKSVIVLNNGKNVFPEEIETLLNKVEGIKETFVFEKKEDDGDVKVCVEIVYDKELIKELYNIEGEENIKEFLKSSSVLCA